MKKVLIFLGVIFVGTSIALSEPLLLEQADNVLQPKTFEFGLQDIAYQALIDQTQDISGNQVTILSRQSLSIPLYLKYAFNDKVETWISYPYTSIDANFLKDRTGIFDPTLGLKAVLSNTGLRIGAIAKVQVPWGEKYYREGTNFEPILALRTYSGNTAFNLNVGYNMTQKYTDNTSSLEIDPGDVFTVGFGIELLQGLIEPNQKGFAFISELIYRNISQSEIASVKVPGSEADQWDIDVGMRYNTGDFKTKLGLVFPAGNQEDRTYDMKVVGGLTMLFKL
jgi:hypothetical protein